MNKSLALIDKFRIDRRIPLEGQVIKQLNWEMLTSTASFLKSLFPETWKSSRVFVSRSLGAWHASVWDRPSEHSNLNRSGAYRGEEFATLKLEKHKLGTYS